MTEVQAGKQVREHEFRPGGFWALIVTQFQGAFNDNLFQFIIVFYLISHLAANAGTSVFSVESLGLNLTPEVYVPAMATFIFSLPFIIFPSLFGALSDRFSKQRLALWTKYLEVVIMVLGGVAFYLHSIPFILFTLFLMATQSAMFGPAKYGIMPEILPDQRLSWGNGILQMGTIVAIILGTLMGGGVYEIVKDAPYKASFFLTLLSIFGVIAALFITRPPAANSLQRIPKNPLLPWSGMGAYFGAIRADRVLFNVVIGYIYFWFVGTLMRNTVLSFAKGTLLLPESYTSYLLGAIAIGIGIGAVCAGYMSRSRIELGLVPVGAFGMTVFCLLLALPAGAFDAALMPLGWLGFENVAAPMGALTGITTGYFVAVLLVVFFMGFFGGVFDVPLAASIQARAPQGLKGGVIATTNMLTFVGMAFSSVFMLALGSFMGPRQLFAVTGILTLAMGLYITLRLPHLLLRAVLWALASTFFRVHVGGREHVTAQGGALWVANHISLLDALAIAASTDRNVHFVMDRRVLDVRWMARICRLLKVIPVDTRDAGALDDAVTEIRRLIALGNVVCVNSECRMVIEGPEVPWYKDYGLLVETTLAPVVPVHMSRLWEKVYIFREGRLIIKRRFWRRMAIHVQYTPPTLHTDGITVRTAVADAGLESYLHREHEADLLHRGFIKSARRNLKHRAISDATSGELSYFKALVGSIVFARKLQRILDQQPMTALLLPPSVGGTLANLSLQMLGKVAVNLNYTASEVVIASCAKQCNITQVLTSKKFLEKLPMAVPGQPIFLEDIKDSVKGSDRIVAILLALLVPIRLLEKILGAPKRTEHDLATVIFSSGSEGEPKGVMLTHRNIMSNVVSALEVFPHNRDTCLIGYLPFFHSFGYMATLWMPLANGLSATFHPNPLEPKQIGELSKKYRGTIMIGTSTLLQGFIRKCTEEQFEALDFVVCGAEKLAARVRIAFKEKFGVEPLEGYGTTECAPAVSVNIPDCVSPGFYYHGTKHGSIGRPLPGQRVRIVNPDTGLPVELGEAGLLLVKGPNIMQGYLHQPEKTASVLQDGWYTTGDIAALDEEGFITITDRLARFSKIAGEMVPHTRVEETLHTLLDLTEQSMAVASVPDQQKGERLIVLHVLEEAQVQELLGKMDQSGLPNLWLPRANSFFRIEQIPVLGNGKMDIKTIKQLAITLYVER